MHAVAMTDLFDSAGDSAAWSRWVGAADIPWIAVRVPAELAVLLVHGQCGVFGHKLLEGSQCRFDPFTKLCRQHLLGEDDGVDADAGFGSIRPRMARGATARQPRLHHAS